MYIYIIITPSTIIYLYIYTQIWLKNNMKLQLDKEVKKVMNVEAMEILINAMERRTGLSPDPVPLVRFDWYLLACNIYLLYFFI